MLFPVPHRTVWTSSVVTPDSRTRSPWAWPGLCRSSPCSPGSVLGHWLPRSGPPAEASLRGSDRAMCGEAELQDTARTCPRRRGEDTRRMWRTWRTSSRTWWSKRQSSHVTHMLTIIILWSGMLGSPMKEYNTGAPPPANINHPLAWRKPSDDP